MHHLDLLGTWHGASQLIKRSDAENLNAHLTHMLGSGNDGQPDQPKHPLSNAQVAALVFTVLIGSIVISLVQYTFKLLLTLTVVEEPPSLYLSVEEDAEALNAPTTPHLVRQTGDRNFITSSIRGTLRHLRQQAGIWSPWRGFAANFVFLIAFAFFQGTITKFFGIVLPLGLATFAATVASMVLLSKLALVCTHIMITAPEHSSWCTRYQKTTWAQANKTVPAIVLWACALQIPTLVSLLGASEDILPTVRIRIFGVGLLLYILINIPATIILARVQASVLADDAVTIVPFDKTFGQDTSDSDGVLTLKKAIQSIDCAVVKRVCIFLAKSIPIILAINTIFVVLFMAMFFSWLPDGPPFA